VLLDLVAHDMCCAVLHGAVLGPLQALDIGCGYGGTAMAVARQLQCCITGINISHYQVGGAAATVFQQHHCAMGVLTQLFHAC
jgi:cyclopropane fatty-acyl-phospholipid synthase-like methyltransferase